MQQIYTEEQETVDRKKAYMQVLLSSKHLYVKPNTQSVDDKARLWSDAWWGPLRQCGWVLGHKGLLWVTLAEVGHGLADSRRDGRV